MRGFPPTQCSIAWMRPAPSLMTSTSIVFYEKPFLKFERLLETYIGTAPRGFRSFRIAMPLWIKQKLFQKRMLRKELRASRCAGGWP